MANRRFTQFMYSMESMPVQLQCTFTVAAANAAGYGQTGLVGPGIQAVYMKTSSTPAGTVNPGNGVIMVKLQDNYNKLLALDWDVQAPTTGAAINLNDTGVLTIGNVYQIVTLGTTTTAQWVAAGVPNGVTPAVGLAFVSAITGVGGGTGTVRAMGISKVADIEVMGNSNLSLYPIGKAYQGGWLTLQILSATDASTTTQIPTAPTDGSVITLKFLLSNSSVTVQGQ